MVARSWISPAKGGVPVLSSCTWNAGAVGVGVGEHEDLGGRAGDRRSPASYSFMEQSCLSSLDFDRRDTTRFYLVEGVCHFKSLPFIAEHLVE